MCIWVSKIKGEWDIRLSELDNKEKVRGDRDKR